MTMYTKYVFHSVENDVADRDIKAVLWDVVADQESIINELRTKAFSDSEDSVKTKKLQDLYVRADNCLRKLLDDAKMFTHSLQEMDDCSRAYEQIENENVAQIVATIQDGNELQSIPEQTSQIVADEVVEPAKTEDETKPFIESTEAVEPAKTEDEAKPFIESTEVVEADNPPTNIVSDTTEVVDSENKPAVNLVVDTTGSEETNMSQDALGNVETSENNELQIPVVSASTSTETPNENDAITVSEPVETTDAVPLIMKTIDVPNDGVISETNSDLGSNAESTSTPLIIPTVETQEGVAPVKNDSTDLISTQPPAEEASDSQNSTIDNTVDDKSETDLGSIPVITISSDGPLEAVSASPSSTIEAFDSALPDIIPDSQNQVATTNLEVSDNSLVLKKRSNDNARVIMVSGAQANKLRASLSTNEALMVAKGYFSNNEQSINNGSLETDVATKQSQLEKMMTQANELYAAGRVAEAQAMYNQISELNKKLQVNAVSVK